MCEHSDVCVITRVWKSVGASSLISIYINTGNESSCGWQQRSPARQQALTCLPRFLSARAMGNFPLVGYPWFLTHVNTRTNRPKSSDKRSPTAHLQYHTQSCQYGTRLRLFKRFCYFPTKFLTKSM